MNLQNTARFRTCIQYLVEILNVCVSKPIIEVIFAFLFGFSKIDQSVINDISIVEDSPK